MLGVADDERIREARQPATPVFAQVAEHVILRAIQPAAGARRECVADLAGGVVLVLAVADDGDLDAGIERDQASGLPALAAAANDAKFGASG